ncbi:VOC family protein [Nocardia yamanashiensis]|uniref:VOC family protein n=1 Tax=Nocardia yamanashiensis TaxID=209247 RepID=UPI00083576D3|nr:VOC family protein [Nocardia yamanashiensis]
MTVQLDVIGIVVSDMAAALGFYRRLGLEIGDGAENEAHVEVGLPGGMRLTFDTEEVIRSFHPEWRARSGGRIGVAVRCGSPGAVDAKFDELVAAGYHGEVKPFDAFWGQRYAIVADPDGNGVDLYAALGESAQG